MVSGMIIAGIAAAAAGFQIRIGAFTLFALFVAIGFGAISAAGGQTLSIAGMWAIACLAVMEVCYVVSMFGVGIWRRSRRPSETTSLSDPAHHRGD